MKLFAKIKKLKKKNGVKINYERPQGIRAQLLRTYAALDDQMFDSSPRTLPKLTFALALFHAVFFFFLAKNLLFVFFFLVVAFKKKNKKRKPHQPLSLSCCLVPPLGRGDKAARERKIPPSEKKNKLVFSLHGSTHLLFFLFFLKTCSGAKVVLEKRRMRKKSQLLSLSLSLLDCCDFVFFFGIFSCCSHGKGKQK